MTVTREEVEALAGQHPMALALGRKGIDPDRLAAKLAEELEAQQTKIVKVDGNVTPGRKDVHVVSKVKRGKVVLQTVLAVNMVNWGTRQAARIDAQKLLGAYPDKGSDPDGGRTVIVKLNIGGARAENEKDNG